jgi:hypothetical protein
MTIRDLIDALIQLESKTSGSEQVKVMVHDIPGIEAVFGAHIERLGEDENGTITIIAVAP